MKRPFVSDKKMVLNILTLKELPKTGGMKKWKRKKYYKIMLKKNLKKTMMKKTWRNQEKIKIDFQPSTSVIDFSHWHSASVFNLRRSIIFNQVLVFFLALQRKASAVELAKILELYYAGHRQGLQPEASAVSSAVRLLKTHTVNLLS